MKKAFSRILTLCLLLCLLASVAAPGLAAAKPTIANSTLWAGVGKSAVLVQNLPGNAKSFSITSSRKDIIKVGCGDRNDPSTLWLKPLKVGKSKITVKYKAGGKSYSVSSTFTVKKYPNPLAWVKVNGKKIDLKKNKLGYDLESYTKKKLTVDYALSSGWKVRRRFVSMFVDNDIKDVAWKKGKAIDLSNVPAAIVTLVLYNSKTDDEFLYMFFVTR